MNNLVFQNITFDKEHGQPFFKKVLGVAIKELDLEEKDIEMSVNLIGEEEIRELNLKYRNKDKATDVLSFPIETKPLKQSGVLPLGDIFICLSFAKNEAKSENISIDRKLAHLTVHGFLHLLGYDHENSAQEADKMENLEKIILSKLNY